MRSTIDYPTDRDFLLPGNTTTAMVLREMRHMNVRELTAHQTKFSHLSTQRSLELCNQMSPCLPCVSQKPSLPENKGLRVALHWQPIPNLIPQTCSCVWWDGPLGHNYEVHPAKCIRFMQSRKWQASCPNSSLRLSGWCDVCQFHRVSMQPHAPKTLENEYKRAVEIRAST
ncbi:hypothetical protein PZA11_001373 [Diplocarpon coronariae]